jgi:hypothetical protein
MLGADSLGLALVGVEAVAVPVCTVPPPPSISVVGGGDSGAIAGICGAGAAMAEGGSAVCGMDVLCVVDPAEAAAAAAAA